MKISNYATSQFLSIKVENSHFNCQFLGVSMDLLPILLFLLLTSQILYSRTLLYKWLYSCIYTILPGWWKFFWRKCKPRKSHLNSWKYLAKVFKKQKLLESRKEFRKSFIFVLLLIFQYCVLQFFLANRVKWLLCGYFAASPINFREVSASIKSNDNYLGKFREVSQYNNSDGGYINYM